MNQKLARISCIVAMSSALCACGGGVPQSALSATSPDRVLTSVARGVAPFHPDRRRSWISSELAETASPVLFVSDSGTADVYIYTLPALKLVGTVTGFTQPQGECSDNKGDVWVTDTNAQTIYELSHKGQLENELTESHGYPAGCAFDSTTGNLAVMNLFGTGTTSGDVLIYAHASGSPKAYTNPAQFYYSFGGYDTSGNLFFDGRTPGGGFILSELSQGASSAHTIKLSGGTIYFAGMVQWNSAKHDLLVGDQSCDNKYASCLYTLTISGSTGTITASTAFDNYSGTAICDLAQGVEFNNEIAGSDYDFCDSIPSSTYLWPYPSGGKPSDYNSTTDSAPIGAAISK